MAVSPPPRAAALPAADGRPLALPGPADDGADDGGRASPWLTADMLAETHEYLASARPDWKKPMWEIRAQGGPWSCPMCGGPSYLVYRCSKCGKDLCGD